MTTTKQLQSRLQVLQQLEGTLMSRISHLSQLGSQYAGKRDLYKALGYKTTLSFADYYAQYRRQDIAKAIIDRPVETTWKGDLLIRETDDMDTPLELAWKELQERLSLKSRFSRLDKLAGLGQYAVLLLGLDDTASISDFGNPVVLPGRKLLYVKPISQDNAVVKTTVSDAHDARFGLPEIYGIVLATGAEINVHHTRIIHVSGSLLEDEVYGEPRLEAVFNRLMDLEKIVGGSAEMFWRGARPGHQVNVDIDADFLPEDKENLETQIDEYEHKVRRLLILQGMELKELSTQVSDPGNHVHVQIEMISAETGIPKRILTGSERGELASTEDKNSWLEKMQMRREEFAESAIVRAFVDRCIEYGVLPPPSKAETYTIVWEDLFAPSEEDKAEVGEIRARALKEYTANPVAQDTLPPEQFFKYCMGLKEQDVEIIMQAIDAEIVKEIDDEKGDDIHDEDDIVEEVRDI